jgi:hypothetical protein
MTQSFVFTPSEDFDPNTTTAGHIRTVFILTLTRLRLRPTSLVIMDHDHSE